MRAFRRLCSHLGGIMEHIIERLINLYVEIADSMEYDRMMEFVDVVHANIILPGFDEALLHRIIEKILLSASLVPDNERELYLDSIKDVLCLPGFDFSLRQFEKLSPVDRESVLSLISSLCNP